MRDDFSVGGAVQWLAIDFEDLVANLKIRLVRRRSYTKGQTQKKFDLRKKNPFCMFREPLKERARAIFIWIEQKKMVDL